MMLVHQAGQTFLYHPVSGFTANPKQIFVARLSSGES